MNTHKPLKNKAFLDIVWQYKSYFAMYTLVVACVTFTVLYLAGGVPDELRVLNVKPTPTLVLAQNSTSTPALAKEVKKIEQAVGELPIKISISKIGVDATINNPTSTDINILNSLLLEGAVRYPGSGTLGQGNLFLFGHSTGIKIVNNQAYKTFNHLNQLAIGDVVKVRSSSREYIYKVTLISQVDSNKEIVDFSKQKNMLTLSTCDIFGKKQQRFVVEAAFEKSILI